MKTVLTIAGSDSGGGAGIQADMKTMLTNGVYSSCAITAVTCQNTLGVYGIQEITPDILRGQLEAVFSDLAPDAVKIGMISSAEQVSVIADVLRKYHAEHVVIDPVMISTSGTRLLPEDAEYALREELFPLAEVITPNIPEALELLPDRNQTPGGGITEELQKQMAGKLTDALHTSVLLKGGHVHEASSPDESHTGGKKAVDVLCDCSDGSIYRYEDRWVNNSNTHGTGCTLSSAIAANLAKGCTLPESVGRAKDYITECIGRMLDLGHGNGPLDHSIGLAGKFAG